MKNALHFLLFSAIPLAAGCCLDLEGLDLGLDASHKSNSDCLRFDSTTALEVVWQKPLWNDTAMSEATPVVFDDMVLLAYTGRDCGKLKMLDARDGRVLWFGEDPSGGDVARLGSSTPRHEHCLVLRDGKKIVLLDLKTGLKSPLLEAPSTIQQGISVREGELFYSLNACDSALNYSILLRKHLAGGQPESLGDTLFVCGIDSYWSPHQSLPAFGEDPKGGALMAFANYRYWNSDFHLDLVVCNLSSGKVLHEIKDVELNDGTQGHAGIVSCANQVYLLTRQACRCFDFFTGELLWEKPSAAACFPEGFEPVEAGCQVSGSVRYSIAEQYKLAALDLKTDAILWTQSSPNYTTCTSSGYPHDPPRFSGGVAIHPELSYLYASDRYYAMCIKLPER